MSSASTYMQLLKSYEAAGKNGGLDADIAQSKAQPRSRQLLVLVLSRHLSSSWDGGVFLEQPA